MRDSYYYIIREEGYYIVPRILGLIASLIIRLRLSKLKFVPILF